MQPDGCIGPEIRSQELFLSYKSNCVCAINKTEVHKFMKTLSR